MYIALLYVPLIWAMMYFYSLEEMALYIVALSIFVFLIEKNSAIKKILAGVIVLALLTYITKNPLLIKSVPFLISLVVCYLFYNAYKTKNFFLIRVFEKIKRKEPNEIERNFLSFSHLCWIGITFLNSMALLYVLVYENNNIWALYSGIGWYGVYGVLIVFNILAGEVLFFIKSKK